ncbi:hypothetical protein NMG60_11016380 [Bertholletia excelsa]
MEVAIPPAMDFDFNTTPCLSAPSTPKRFGEYYFSTPTSPTKLSKFYRDFDDFLVETSFSSTQLDWEEKLNSPKSSKSKGGFEDEFAFDVSGESSKTTVPAEDLFSGGKIRPMKQQTGDFDASSSPLTATEGTQKRTKPERGRERVVSLSSSGSRRGSRSLSPCRVSKYPWEEEKQQRQQQIQEHNTKKSSSIIPKLTSKNKKWKLKDFFLFRSASEGRASEKDPLKKYTALFKKHEEAKASSFRSIEGSVSSRKKGGEVSAHELHYTMNRAISEDMKKKTFLPYKQGILGRLAFNPAVHALANGFGFSRR